MDSGGAPHGAVGARRSGSTGWMVRKYKLCVRALSAGCARAELKIEISAYRTASASAESELRAIR
jgi:hypothetical protein